MSERGVFAIDRGIWSHPVFKPEPFTEREAWQWLIGEASYKDRAKNVEGAVVHLTRGQLSHSVRFMAEAWKWSKSRVDRFLARLKTETMIGTESGTNVGTRQIVITICNYDKYQKVSLPAGTTEGTSSGTNDGTTAGQQRDKLENNKNIESLTRSVAKRRDRAKPYHRFEEFWAIYPRRDGPNPKKPALAVYLQAVKAGTSEQEIIDGAKRYRADIARRDQQGSRFIAQAKTWLNQARWTDDLPPSMGNNPPPFAIAPAPSAHAVVAPDWERKMTGYVALPAYQRAWYGPGAPPGRPGCEVPAELQRKYGFEPQPRAIAAGE